MKLRITALLAVGSATITGASAISFTDILINGNPAAPGQVTGFGTTGLTFSLPSFFQVGSGMRSLELSYKVTASPGHFLTEVEQIPVGVIQNAIVTITARHLNDGEQQAVFSQFAEGPTQPLGSSSSLLTGQKTTFNVSTTIHMNVFDNAGLGHVSIYNVNYTEAVPEPASMAVLGAGLAMMIRRRKKK
jgi:hypothetical protein